MSGTPVETPAAAAARFLNSLFKPSHILVAISGGGDSVGLLVALAEAIRAENHSHRLSAASVDHGLRAESADEVQQVADLCAGLGIPHQSRRWEGEKPSSGLMAAAREARYELLADMAASFGADLIVTAHTLDDQQETLVMRGARLAVDAAPLSRGIADAVLFDRRIWIVRPFLNCLRQDLREFLVERGVRWIDDPSNEDTHYERVRVRAALRDSVGSELPAINAHVAMDLSAQAAGWLDAHVQIHAAVLCEIARVALAAEPRVLAYGLSHLAAVLGGQPFGPSRDTVARIIDFLAAGEAGRRTAGGVVFDLRRDALYLMREGRNIAPLVLSAGSRGIWDGRFDVVNDSGAEVRIIEGNLEVAATLPASIPKGVVGRVAATAPRIILSEEMGKPLAPTSPLWGEVPSAAEAMRGDFARETPSSDPSGPLLPAGEKGSQAVGFPAHDLEFDEDSGPAGNDTVKINPRLAPFDRFLTRFDRSFADRLALCFSRMPYLSPPL